jgi:Spy/CpxP family protein refolding chaperone
MADLTRILRGLGILGVCVAVSGPAALPFQPVVAASEQSRSGGPGRGGPEGQNVRAWWRNPEIAQEVGLTSAQITKLDKLYVDRQKRIEPWVAEYKTQNAELNRMMRQGTASPEEIEAQARRLMYPILDIIVSRFRLLYEMGQVMTPEQNAKLRARFDRERRSREQGRSPGQGPGN